ncbi:Lariat Debranching Enzyme [Manis pentadactyla]|nr:Lariat Debranching Enzyme [Manis pentadactyla]
MLTTQRLSSGRLWNMPENNGLHARWDYSTAEEAMNEVLEKLNHDLRVPYEIMLDEEEEGEDSTVSAYSDVNTPSAESSSDQASDFSASFCDVRILPGSMIVSSDDTPGSPVGKEGRPGEAGESRDGKDLPQVLLKRLSDEHEPEQRKRIKRRNQAIYATVMV